MIGSWKRDVVREVLITETNNYWTKKMDEARRKLLLERDIILTENETITSEKSIQMEGVAK